ncbi:MAG: nucleotide exchange factor GrpE [Lewinellaceae bacterium]|nr:nucleotide exchange factor GrpE [Saprospiraceae bacterium]MCB9336685.1 nucleotide exchange factor GrpE [Lewinellaceae bacterium]
MSKKNMDATTQTDERLDQASPDGQDTAEMAQNGNPGSEADELNEVIELKQQVGELKDKYMRLFAEFENFKKRSIREKLDWIKTASQDTLSALLPVLDDFDRAKKFAAENKEATWSEGVDLVYQKLYNSLKQKGLEPMESNGEPFDPELHDAITEIPAPTDNMKGKVIDTIEKGYRLNDKIIRHAKVVVGK